MGEDLLQKVTGGDRDAFDELTRKYSSFVKTCIYKALHQYSFTPAREDVDDLHNTFFVSLMEDDFRRIRQFEGRASFKTYLKVVIIRQVVDFLRRQKRLSSLDSESIHPSSLCDQTPHAATLLELTEENRILAEAIQSLKPADRLLLKLVVYKGLPATKICKIMNLSMVAYYNRKSRIIKRLRDVCEKSPISASIRVRR